MRQMSPTHSPVLRHRSVSGGKDLNECVYKNDIDGARAHLHDNKMAWNTKNERGLTPLMEASILNRLEILDLLLAAKCDVNVTDENGSTSLHLAVDEGNTEVIRKLIKTGRCIVDAKTCTGETALMKAAFYDYSEMVRMILTEGEADPDVQDNTGQTALHIALREDSHVTVDLLLKHGCDLSVMDNLGQSALYVAIHSPCNRTLDMAKRIILAGYDIAADKLWLLNEEKHNLFYQDDDFYASLRQTLRQNSHDVHNDLITYRQSSTDSDQSDTRFSISPVVSPKQLSPTSTPFAMSPLLKQKVRSSQSPKYPSIPLNQTPRSESFDSSRASPLCVRRNDFIKSKSFEQMKPKATLRPPLTSSFSSDSDVSPFGSPASRHRVTSALVKNSENDGHVTSVLLSNTYGATERVIKRDRREGTFSFPANRSAHLRADDEKPRSAPCSPILLRQRQLSLGQRRSGSDDNLSERKLSLPAKTTVKFSTEIQVFEYNRRK